jgi:hypothetical protein
MGFFVHKAIISVDDQAEFVGFEVLSLSLLCLLGLLFKSEDEAVHSSKKWYTSMKLHSITFQKTIFFSGEFLSDSMLYNQTEDN